MASAMLWWLASTYYPLERARNVKNRAPLKRDNLAKVRKRTIAARNMKPTVSVVRTSSMISPVDNTGKICRVCLKDGEIPICGTGTDLCEAVKVFGDIQIEKGDKLPKYLCGTCHSMLQSAILFRIRAKETELLLQKKIKEEFSDSVPKKPYSAAVEECKVKIVSKKLEPQSIFYKTESEFVVKKQQKIESKGESSKSVAKKSQLEDHFGGQSAPVVECKEEVVSDKHKPKPILCHKTESEFEVKEHGRSKEYIDLQLTSLDSQEVHKQEMDNAISCRVCKLKFTSTSEYTSHKSSEQHKKSLMLYFTHCKVCKKTILSSLFQQHLKLHTSKSKICEICGKTYSTSFGLYSHVQLHSSELPFHCTYCPYRGKTASSYRIHLRTHTGEKPYTCEECGMGYTTKSNLVKHCLRHKEKQFKCNECEKSYYEKRDLEDHVKCVHLCTEEFECEMCGNKFRCKKRLRKHERKVHKKSTITRGRKPLYLQNES